LLEAGQVASSCDPRTTFLKLLPRGDAWARAERNLRAFRARGTTAHISWALDRPPAFPAAGGITPEFARISPGLLQIERAFDAVKYRRFSDEPALEVHIPGVADGERAPAGHAVVSALVHFAPRDLEAGWDDSQREALADRASAILELHAPGFSSSVVARKVRSPADLEEEYGLDGGQIHHGEHYLDQLLIRPVPGCVGYRTPVTGLFLCGGGSHPGGGLTCAPGALAAETMLEHS
jgi:phytoene dehydrogenase-like protein